ncbi:MAG: hypothetical protein U9R50_09955 [Campylobacterota bacterium]|nr:hypothetical protein [Campylobacterota bacterium]
MKKLLYGLFFISTILYANSYQADNRDKGFEQECKNELDYRNPENPFYSGKMYGILDMATYSTPKDERNPKIKGYSASNIMRIICDKTLNDVRGNRQYGFFSNFQWHTLKTVAD